MKFASLALAAAAVTLATGAHAQSKIKVGLMLPATGTFASLGTAIDNGFRLYVAEQGGKIAGREVEDSRTTHQPESAIGHAEC